MASSRGTPPPPAMARFGILVANFGGRRKAAWKMDEFIRAIVDSPVQLAFYQEWDDEVISDVNIETEFHKIGNEFGLMTLARRSSVERVEII